ncbi:MAG: hypothetical protein LBP51_01860 [Deferribacteraceae bacterium]|jgi:hypothetical protein|nr:hypothetical protein [Deferribacteraceae bacterium]
MRSKSAVIIILLFFFAAGCALYRYAAPYRNFDHELHENNIVKSNKDCFTCHKTEVPANFVEEKDSIKKSAMIRKMLEQIGDKKEFNQGECHACHTETKTKALGAPGRCEVCHDNLNQVKPESHKGTWRSNHAVIALENGYNGVIRGSAEKTEYTCDSCHNQWFCINCHNARGETDRSMHPRTFRASHVPLALIDPAQCSACHTVGYCSACHTKRR